MTNLPGVRIRDQESAVRGRSSVSAEEDRYNARLFLEDEERLLADRAPDLAPLQCVELPDGRLMPLPTDPLRRAMKSGSQECFSDRYGSRLGEERERLFRLAVEYVAAHSDELMEAGLASAGETIAVREEFLDFLLSWPVEPTRPRIPRAALARFLDEWGLRWM